MSVIRGYACPFGGETIVDSMHELIEPTAISLASGYVRLFFGSHTGRSIARTGDASLRLRRDKLGLAFEARVDDVAAYHAIAAGAIEGCSINLHIIEAAGMAVGLARAPDVAAHVGAGDDDTTAFGGFLSGIILLWIIARGQHDETRRSASLGGAYRMVASACGKAGLRGGGVDHLRQNIWPGYRSVAHLWAAHIVWWDSTKRDHAALDTRAGLSEFLMISEALRREGEAFKPFRAGAPILDPVETWKVRPEVSATWPPLEFRFGDPDAWDLRKRPRL